MKIYLDASALYAFIDRADPNHIHSSKLLEQFSVQRVSIYTSIQVVQDIFTAINNQLGNTISFEFLQAIVESDIEVLYPQKADFLASFRLIKLNRNKQISLKEALTATIMQKKGITQILTFTYWPNLLGSQPYLARM
jgi:predicted nucleic acid-binding protein